MDEKKKEKEGKTLTLDEKGVLSIGFLVLSLTFALGFMTHLKIGDQKTTIFSREDLERIATLQEIEDEAESGAEIYAYKDKDGNLMIGWKQSKFKRK